MTLTLTLTGKFYKILRELHADMHPAGGQMLCDLRRGDVVRPGTDQKKPRLRITQPGPCLGTSKTVSRVLYLTVIYLDAPLPVRSSHPGSGRADRGARGSCSHTGVAPNRVYSDGYFHAPSGELLPRLSTLTAKAQPWWRYISVALFLKSPSAGVTRYPCPVEPGLSSRKGLSPLPRDCLFSSRVYCTQNSGKSQWEVDQ